MAASILSSLVLAAADPTDPTSSGGPNLQEAIITAYDWHLGGGGLYAFASNGGKITDEAVRAAALQEVEQSQAWVNSQAAEVDAGSIPELKTDFDAARAQGIPASAYITQRLDNLRSALTQGQPETAPEAQPDPDPAPAPVAVPPAPVTGASKEARTVISVTVFNQARQIAQKMQQQLEGTNSELEGKVAKILFDLDQIETQAGGNLSHALDDELDPSSANWAARLIKTLSQLQHEAGMATPQPKPGAQAPTDEQMGQYTTHAMAHLKVQAFLQDEKLITPGTRVKTATDGSVHVTALLPGAATLGKLLKFAGTHKISVHLVKAFEEEDEDATCPGCGGPGVPLGALGNSKHYRCRDCGVGFSHEAEAKEASAVPDTLHPARPRSEELPYNEDGSLPAFDNPTVPGALHTAAGPEPEDHVIKIGKGYLVVGSDATPETGGAKLSLTPSQRQATHMSHALATLWFSDDRLANFIASEAPAGEEARVVRVVPKKMAAAKVANRYIVNKPGHKDSEGKPAPWCVLDKGGAIISSHASEDLAEKSFRGMEMRKHASAPKEALTLPPPTANGNHAGPANPVNPTGAPAPGTPSAPPVATPPSTQGPQVMHTNPGVQQPAPVVPPAPGQPQVDAQGRPIQASAVTASEGTLNGILSEADGAISQLQELADSALAKARLLNDEDLVAAVERMNTSVFEAGMAARHAKGLASGTKASEKKEDKDEDGEQKPGELKEASAKTACDGKDCKGDCPNCKNKKEGKQASSKTADNAEQSAMAREVVLDWAATHPKQAPDWASPDWKQIWEQNRAECPDENAFITACQRAYAEMSKSLNKVSRTVAALALKARGLMGPSAEKGDSVANAVKFMHGNAKDIEDETVAGLRQLLADAGYSRTVVELAIEEVFGADATLANGALLKTLLKGKE